MIEDIKSKVRVLRLVRDLTASDPGVQSLLLPHATTREAVLGGAGMS